MYIYKGHQIPQYKDPRWDLILESFMHETIDHLEEQDALFEFVSKNIKSYNHTISYIGDNIHIITYDLGNGLSINKVFDYDQNNCLHKISLTGNIPGSLIKTTKTLTYIGDNVSSITYN